MDVESAHHIVPVHPDDRPLLDMRWKDKFYIFYAVISALWLVPKINCWSIGMDRKASESLLLLKIIQREGVVLQGDGF